MGGVRRKGEIFFFSKLKQSVTHALPDRMGRKNHGRFCPVISSIAFGSPCMMSVMLENIQTSLPR